MERKNVFKHIFQGYILPKDKQSMISMTRYNIENPLGKGRETSWHYPYSSVWIIEQETFSIGLQMFLLKIGVPQTCIEIALTLSSSKGQPSDTQRTHQERLIEQVLQFPHGRMVNLAKKDNITIGPPARC